LSILAEAVDGEFGTINKLPVLPQVNIDKIYNKSPIGIINYSSLFVQNYISSSSILISCGNAPNPMSYSYNNGLSWVANNNAGQLLAIGKLANSIRKRNDVDMNFLIRLDLDKNIIV